MQVVQIEEGITRKDTKSLGWEKGNITSIVPEGLEVE